VLPAVALALGWIGYFARLVRASMLEVMNTNYIRTAYAYGLGERVIFYRHALRNAIIPTVAVLGVGLGELMGGAVFIESIFSRVGLGTLIVDSIQNRNYPVVRGVVLTIAVLFVLANLLADLSYRYLDPRIRVEESAAP
jgi:peptide/nickel transport system permease protein